MKKQKKWRPQLKSNRMSCRNFQTTKLSRKGRKGTLKEWSQKERMIEHLSLQIHDRNLVKIY